ncbi:MAG: hypothetical protein ACLPXT_06760 [Terracidiphilus sp.]
MNAPATPAFFGPAHQHPMTFGQILDRIYRLIRSQLKLLIGIASVLAAAYFLIIALAGTIIFIPILTQQQTNPDPAVIFRIIIPVILVTLPLNLAIFAFYLAASIYAALQANLGVAVTFREACGLAWKRIGRYLWLLFLAYIIAFLPALVLELVMFVPMALFTAHKTTPPTAFFILLPLEMLLFIAAIVYGIIMAMRLSLAFPASLAEGLTARAAIRRSGQLTQGAKGRIFLVLLVIYAFGYVVEMVGVMGLMAVLGIGVLAAMALHIHLASVAGIAGVVLFALCCLAFLFLWMALLWSAFSASFAVLYHDQRLRKDGSPLAPSQAVEAQA